MRVVSVLPSATEMVFALGHGPELVGRSAECDYPAAVRDRPVVMWPRAWDSAAPSAEIDARVTTSREKGESLYTLDIPRLSSLQPDLLLTQDLCGVCSVTGTEVAEACARAGVRPQVVSLTPRSLEDVWSSVEVVGAALNDSRRGEALATSLRAGSAPVPGHSAGRVAVVEWLDPPILSGLWTPDIVHAAGGAAVRTESGRPGVRTTWPELAEEHPDLVILSPCSFSVERTSAELRRPEIRRSMAELGSPPRGMFVADEAYFSRPGPRLADGVELVRHLLRGDSWTAPMPVQAWREGEVAA